MMTKEELVRYVGDVRNSKGFDIENDTPLVERWMDPVDQLQGPEAATIERCARVAVHRYNVKKKGKKILKFDKVVKATLAIKSIRVYYITLEAESKMRQQLIRPGVFTPTILISVLSQVAIASLAYAAFGGQEKYVI
ncbi:unnamed protein product [Dovyalis caffra]|uniref:Uncharacterized protein n=1 Tax=Dovyalis caffra TaxID=77055 RepID=A0AAV1SIN8_9ROSI|nr:unnamed protein product [Dovyalis caffra]